MLTLAEGVLQQLGGLGRAAGRHRHDRLDRLGSRAPRPSPGRPACSRRRLWGSWPPCCRDCPGLRVRARRPGENPRPAFKPEPVFQHLAQILVGRAGIGGGFQHHQRPLAQMRRDGFARFDDVGDVRLAILVQRRGHADDDRLRLSSPAQNRSKHETARPGPPSAIVCRLRCA